MIVALFEVEGGIVKPTNACFSLKTLKDIMDNHKDYLKIYQYLYYMTYPSPENPFFHTPEEDKEELIMKEIQGKFSLDDDHILEGLAFCKKLYETPSYKAYKSLGGVLDRIAEYMNSAKITTGRDGSLTAIMGAAKDLHKIRKEFQQAYNDMLEEQKSTNRGNSFEAYDAK